MRLAASTINLYLYGIRDWCIGQGLPNPLRDQLGGPLLRLDRILKFIKKLQKVKERPRLLIIIDVLRMLISFLTFGCFGQCDGRMLSASMTLAFFGFLWCGEFTMPNQNAYQPHRDLSMQDVIFYPTMEEAAYMTIRFKYSKPDPFGKGHTVTLHATNTLTCPVQAMRHYLKLRSYHAQSPLFLLADGTVLTCFKFVTSLQCLLAKVGLQAELYAGHSFRIGAATTAATAGLADWFIQAMGSWSSYCYKRYIRLTNTSLHQACLEMAHTTHIW